MNSTNRKPPLPQRFNRQIRHASPVAAQLKTAVAPPVYRPQPTPRVLQRKSTPAQNPQMGPTPRGPVAPPVYRPEAKKIVQRIEQVRKGGLPPLSKTPTAPPVYRPEQNRVGQSPIAQTPKARTVHSVQVKAITPQAGRPMLMRSQQINPSAVQRKLAPHVRGHASRVVQCEPTDEEKELLAPRIGAIPYRFKTVDERELAIGPTNDYYMLIRLQDGRAYWRKYRLKRIGGRGFYGRLVDAPPSLEEIAADINEMDVWSQAACRQIDFSAGVAKRDRDNNNHVMGLYFLDGMRQLPASVYARRPHYEWLHMQGHGLGGVEDPDNLYAGSHGANSHMAAVETALQTMRDIYGNALTVNVRVVADEDYHDRTVCSQIAAMLKLDESDVFHAMFGKESRMLEYIEYRVRVGGERVWTERILAFENRFDEGQFNQIRHRVKDAIKGIRSPIAFVPGGVLPATF